MSDDLIKLEVDGVEVEARRGQMLIEVTDAARKYVPRFCYHEKLSIAANCRMCLVEVEKAPKPLPACATPVADGMKVFTRSAYAIAAQKATMEFLLINHPLDCPICDQGGECELQDLAMGYGRDVSRYTDRKRVVKDKNIGPLVSTDMTRCIHCTRCVRFGQEIAGIQELGTTGRGENMQIGTFIENSVDHELSGNIIDLCPVGALNNKPYRYSARAWEMEQSPTISPHDCVGTNINAHVLRGTVKRIVPRNNEEINETWIADRDRFSYEAIYSDDRLLTPEVRTPDGDWKSISWDEALAAVASSLKSKKGNDIGVLCSPSATLEEQFLLGQIADVLRTSNVDHRLAQVDFTDQGGDPKVPGLGISIADIESRDAILIIASDIRAEAPLIAHRVRKAALGGAKVSLVDSNDHEFNFQLSESLSGDIVGDLFAIASALEVSEKQIPKSLADGLRSAAVTERHRTIAAELRASEKGSVILGTAAARHPAYSAIRALARAIASATAATCGGLTEGANSAGAYAVGLLPHRSVAGAARSHTGMHAADMLKNALGAYILMGVEPDADLAAANAIASLEEAGTVIAVTPFASESLRKVATIMLPAGTFAETSGSFINTEGRLQSFKGVATPVAEARPGWKVLRVLLNLLGREDAQYLSSEDVLAHALEASGSVETGTATSGAASLDGLNGSADRLHVPIYEVDALSRRATALQQTRAGRAGAEWRKRLP